MFSTPEPHSADDGVIVEVDWHTGRVRRIPGVYPWAERWARWRPAALVMMGCALFVALGILI